MLHPQQTDGLSVILLRRSSRAVSREFRAERIVQNISDCALLAGGTRRTVCASSSLQDTKRFTSLGTRHCQAGTTTRYTRMHGLLGTLLPRLMRRSRSARSSFWHEMHVDQNYWARPTYFAGSISWRSFAAGNVLARCHLMRRDGHNLLSHSWYA